MTHPSFQDRIVVTRKPFTLGYTWHTYCQELNDSGWKLTYQRALAAGANAYYKMQEATTKVEAEVVNLDDYITRKKER